MRHVYSVLFALASAAIIVLVCGFDIGTRFLDRVAFLASIALAVLAGGGFLLERRQCVKSARIAVRILTGLVALVWLVAAVVLVKQTVSACNADAEIGNALNNTGMYR